MYEIEEGIPLKKIDGRGRKPMYPFAEMKVFDSFSFPAKSKASVANAKSNYQRKNPGREFTIRKDGRKYRCWRVG